ncbi:hypothetical protein SDJN03_04457, partial [Cucurbita argyrosperma subsp. sororia]
MEKKKKKKNGEFCKIRREERKGMGMRLPKDANPPPQRLSAMHDGGKHKKAKAKAMAKAKTRPIWESTKQPPGAPQHLKCF